MNAHSSRSHAILTITIECMDKGPDNKQRIRVGHLHMVDLAGSERQVSSIFFVEVFITPDIRVPIRPLNRNKLPRTAYKATQNCVDLSLGSG